MKLRRLKLENFRQHLATDVEFNDGMTAIIGPNGSGKSTVLEAIGYALYANTRANKDQIPSYWQDEKKFTAVLEFDLDDRQYSVTRTESKARLDEKVEGQWEERAEGASNVTVTVRKLLGLSYYEFTNSFCALQKEIDFLKGSTTGRRDEIAKMLGYDDLRKAEDLAKETVKNGRAELQGLSQSPQVDPKILEEESRAKQLQATELAEALRSTIDQIEILSAQIPPAQRLVQQARRFATLTQEISDMKSEGRSLATSIQSAEKELEVLSVDLTRLQNAQENAALFLKYEVNIFELEKLRDAEASHERARALWEAEAQRLRTELAGVPSLIAGDLEQQLADLQTRLDVHTVSLELKRKERDQLQNEAAQLRAEAREAATRLARSQDLLSKGQCPECGQPFSGDYRLRLVSEQDRLSAKQSASEQSLKRLAQANQDLLQLEADRSLAAERDVLQAELGRANARAQLQAKLDRHLSQEISLGYQTVFNQDDLDAAKAARESVRADYQLSLSLAQVPQNHQQKSEQLDNLRLEFAKSKTKYAGILAEADALEIKTSDDSARAIEHMAKLESDLNHQKMSKTQLERTSQGIQLDLQSIEARKASAQSHEETKRLLERRIALHAEAAKQLKGLRENLNRQLNPLIRERAEKNLQELTGGRYSAIELDEKFNATVLEDGKPKSVISGGEEDVLALSLRLALSQLIQSKQGRQLGLLILDEVFGSLDKDRREEVLGCLEQLKDLGAGSFEQVIVISHIEEINHVADHCLYLTLDTESHKTTVSDKPTGADLILPESLKTGLFAEQPR